ncbi:LPS assembly lipoprotein LptE [Denitratisoma sp. agr-D3]
MSKLTSLLLLGLTLVLGACGFHLRNSQDLPFSTLYIALPDYADMRVQLARSIQASSKTQVVADRDEAEAILTVTFDQQQKVILSLNASGRVREYQLKRNFNFRVHDREGRDLMVPAKIELKRDINYTDDLVLSKEAEEALLWRDIQNDLVQQVLRRLSVAKTKPIDPDQP